MLTLDEILETNPLNHKFSGKNDSKALTQDDGLVFHAPRSTVARNIASLGKTELKQSINLRGNSFFPCFKNNGNE